MGNWINERPLFELVIYGLSALLTTVSITTLVLRLKKWLNERPYGFGSVRRVTLGLLDRIDKSGFKPDMVLGIGRSGAFVGGLIAGGLGSLPIEVIERFHTDGQGSFVTFPNHERKMELLKAIYGEEANVLVVEGLSFRGVTLHGFADIKKSLAPGWTCKYAVIFRSRGSSFKCDFVGKSVSHEPRRYPWHIRKEYRDFIITDQPDE